MTIYEFAAARGYTLADTDKLILKRLTEVKGTDEKTLCSPVCGATEGCVHCGGHTANTKHRRARCR